MVYLFSLGRTVDLCFAELQALLKTSRVEHAIKYQNKSHVIIETKKEIDCEELLKKSGGIVKISTLLFVIPAPRPSVAISEGGEAGIQDFFGSEQSRLFTTIKTEKYKNFGVSLVGFQADLKEICEEFKSKLGLHYSLPKVGYELSSAQVSNKGFLELVIVKTEEEYQIFETIFVQDINFWTKKDVGRPFIDDRLGMIPLKVARMMINLALAVIPATCPPIACAQGACRREAGILNNEIKIPELASLVRNDMTILDPFCGMGSILQEAVDLGMDNVIGGDINADVLKKGEENLKWFIESFSFHHVNMMMIKTDAAKISEKLREKVDLIVTEPFLGDARKLKRINESPSLIRGNQNDIKTNQTPTNVAIEIKNITKGLEKMYLGCLKDWKKILKVDGAICIIVPEIEVGKRVFKISFVEICAKTGYNIKAEYEYSRENAVVKRKIYLLKTTKI